MSIDVIIPTYKPDKALFELVKRLNGQSLKPENIIIMNTEEKYWDQLVSGTRFLEQNKNLKVYHVSKREFDHGGTRRLGVKKSQAEIFVMMTQDAMPANERLLEELTGNLQGEIAASYARQLPTKDCSVIEQYMRQFNYPEKSAVKSRKDLDRLGIKTYFCSNVCAAYRREIYDALGGFVKHTIFNEDMLYAASACKAGYGISYEAGAEVLHSHNYTNGQQLHRNFDLGVSQAQHPEVFAGIASEAEGKKLVAGAAKWLWNNGHKSLIPHLIMQSGCKYLGYLLGKNYKKLPEKWVRKLSDNKSYWDR